MSNLLRFDGRVAIVTGSGQGLGQAHAELLASRGTAVVVNDRPDNGEALGRSAKAEAVAAQIIAAGGKAIAIGGDITSKEAMDFLVAKTISQLGRIDILVSNAGIAGYVPFHEITLDQFDTMLRVHMHGAFLLTQAAWPHLKAQRYGRIVLTSSSAIFGLENQAHYAAAKGGVWGLMRALSVEGRQFGITANAILPFADTPMARQVAATSTIGADSAQTTDALFSLASGPELVAPVVAWLSHESCPVTGALAQVGMGRVCRIATARSQGFADPHISIESVRDQWLQTGRCEAPEFLDLSDALQFQLQGPA